MPIDIDLILMVGTVVLILAIVAARIGAQVGLPSLLLFLGLGMALRASGIGISLDDPHLAKALAFAALVLILAEGGMTTKWADIKSSSVLAILMATVGVGVSVALMATFCYFVLGLDLWIAILLGAVTSPTDAAAVFSVLRRVPIPLRLRGALEAESGLNDAPTVLLVTLVSATAAGNGHGSPGVLGLLIIVELAGGIAIGVGLGWVGAQILRRVALPALGLYPLATLVWAVFAYGLAATAHASGFAAVYAAALMLGNARLPHRAATRSFVEGIAWMAQIGLFVMLGLLAVPSRVTLQASLIALVAGLFLTFVARPLAVAVTASWFRISIRHQVFLSWAGLRGAVPIVLATIPLADQIEGAEFLFDVVLVFVIVFTCLQAPTLPVLARLLGLGEDSATQDLEIEAAPLDKIFSELLQVRVPEESRLAGIEVGELRLPRHTVVSLIIRDGRPFYPAPRERIKVGDELLIVTPESQHQNTENRLRQLGQGGRLARWQDRGR